MGHRINAVPCVHRIHTFSVVTLGQVFVEEFADVLLQRAASSCGPSSPSAAGYSSNRRSPPSSRNAHPDAELVSYASFAPVNAHMINCVKRAAAGLHVCVSVCVKTDQ